MGPNTASPADQSRMSSGEELQELNLHRDTWCQVEGRAQQSWNRAQRRHYPTHLRTSPALLSALTGQQVRPGCRDRPPPAPPGRLVERRHYEESKGHLV